MIAKPAKILIISFNNNKPLVESNPKIKDPSEKRAYFTQSGEWHFLDTWRIRVRMMLEEAPNSPVRGNTQRKRTFCGNRNTRTV